MESRKAFIQYSLLPSISSVLCFSRLAEYIFTILMHKTEGKGGSRMSTRFQVFCEHTTHSSSCPQAAVRKAKIKFRFKALSAIERSAILIQADLAQEITVHGKKTLFFLQKWTQHHCISKTAKRCRSKFWSNTAMIFIFSSFERTNKKTTKKT